MNLDEWANSVIGKYIDRDGYGQPPAQCHDIWLDYLERVLGGTIRNPNLGYAPDDYTASVWLKFPAVNGLQKYVAKHVGTYIKRGDVVFWNISPNYPGSHVAVAISDSNGGSVDCITQNPGATKRANLTLAGCLGVLRPINLGDDDVVTQQDKQDIAELVAETLRHHQRENGRSPDASAGRTLFDLGQQSADGLTDTRAASIQHLFQHNLREHGFGWQEATKNGKTLFEYLQEISSDLEDIRKELKSRG